MFCLVFADRTVAERVRHFRSVSVVFRRLRLVFDLGSVSFRRFPSLSVVFRRFPSLPKKSDVLRGFSHIEVFEFRSVTFRRFPSFVFGVLPNRIFDFGGAPRRVLQHRH